MKKACKRYRGELAISLKTLQIPYEISKVFHFFTKPVFCTYVHISKIASTIGISDNVGGQEHISLKDKNMYLLS
ncbi:hypothetical protein PSTEL_14850 [Paenibacillus stellifer]|uniref:Uncharacterized protein n=1 Tax=Paenibacillus stellifer TaxID=169760 RepID=A0A089N5X0_9BACL|nr:hypothetical protein PSTEL_14850 [Paenibacillus stellifer]